MASITPASNYYSQMVAKNKGIAGLATGLDTNSILEALTSGMRSKIAKQMQQKQLVQWKQESYRGIVTAIDAFRDKYFSAKAIGNRIGSSSFFSNFKATTTSNKVNVTTTSSTVPGDIVIDKINSLASTHAIASKPGINKELSSDDISSMFDSNGKVKADAVKGELLSLNVDGVVKNIKLDSLAGVTKDEFQNKLQELVNGAFGTKNGGANPVVEVKLDGNKLSLSNNAGKVSIAASNTKLGFESGDSNRINADKMTLGELVKSANGELVGDTFKININGTEITAKASDTVSSLMSEINKSAAGVRMTYSSITGKFEMTSKTTGLAGYIDMEDVQGNLMSNIFGAKSATSLTSSTIYKDADFTGSGVATIYSLYAGAYTSFNDATSPDPEALKRFIEDFGKNEISMTIGNSTKTIKPIISEDFKNKISDGNTQISQADFLNGVKESLNASISKNFGTSTGVAFDIISTDKFTLKNPGNKHVSMTSKDGPTDGLDIIGFSQNSYSNAVDFTNKTSIAATGAASFSSFSIGNVYEFNLSVNGSEDKKISYTLTEADINALGTTPSEEAKAALLADRLNMAIYAEKSFEGTAFTQNGSTVSQMVVFVPDGNGNINLVTDKNLDVKVSAVENGTGKNALAAFKINDGADNISDDFKNDDLTLDKFGITSGTLNINGKTITIDASTDTMQSLMNQINDNTTGAGAGTAKIVDNKLILNGGDKLNVSTEPDTTNILKKLFGQESYVTKDNDYNTISEAKNAEIVMSVGLNGDKVTVSSSSNTFDINGTKVEVLEKSDEPITIKVESDPDKMIEKFQSFIDDYNALIATLNGTIREKGNSDYQPLTDEQKADMSKEEIEKWEAEAKKGILRYDPTITGILNQFRRSLFGDTNKGEFSLATIGITTISLIESGSANFSRDGQIEITEANMEKLRNLIVNDPDSIKEMFTNAEKGIAQVLSDTIDRATKTSSLKEERGTLITIAGTPILTGDNTSSLGNKIKSYDDNIARLKTQLETQYNRYWKKFSALETAIQRFSAQSSWLTQFSGG